MGIKQVDDHVQYFQTLVQEGTLSHAYLLTGNAHDDKLQVVQKVVEELIKKEPLPQEETRRLIDNVKQDQFADLLFIEPEGQTVRIDQIRQLKEWLSTSSMELNFKVAVIEAADKMNTASSNSLLKLLEEPQERVYLFLLTSEASALLPTIRSRTQQIHFFDSDLTHQLNELQRNYSVSDFHSEVIVRFPTQMQTAILEDYDEADFDQFLKVFNYFYKLLFTKDTYGLIVVQTHLKDCFPKTGASIGLEYLFMLNHSVLMHLVAVKTPPTFQNYWIKEWVNQVDNDPGRCIQIHQNLVNVKERLRFNVAPQLAYEQLVIRCLED